MQPHNASQRVDWWKRDYLFMNAFQEHEELGIMSSSVCDLTRAVTTTAWMNPVSKRTPHWRHAQCQTHVSLHLAWLHAGIALKTVEPIHACERNYVV